MPPSTAFVCAPYLGAGVGTLTVTRRERTGQGLNIVTSPPIGWGDTVLKWKVCFADPAFKPKDVAVDLYFSRSPASVLSGTAVTPAKQLSVSAASVLISANLASRITAVSSDCDVSACSEEMPAACTQRVAVARLWRL